MFWATAIGIAYFLTVLFYGVFAFFYFTGREIDKEIFVLAKWMMLGFIPGANAFILLVLLAICVIAGVVYCFHLLGEFLAKLRKSAMEKRAAEKEARDKEKLKDILSVEEEPDFKSHLGKEKDRWI